MKKILALFLFSVLFLGFSSCSSDDDTNSGGNPDKIEVEAGTFATLIETKGILNSKNLVLSGEMNINDFVALGEMPELQELDMTDVDIVTGTRYDEEQGKDIDYPANELSLHYLHVGNEINEDRWPVNRFKNLITIKLPKNLKVLSAMALGNLPKLKTVIIPNKVENISYAFAGCKELETVILPNNYSGIIGGNAFAYCPKLSSINLTDNVAEMEGGAFNGCTSLKSVVLPKNLSKKIDQNTFTNSGLESITIPASVTIIAPGAFQDCKNLKEVTFASNSQLKSIHDGAFNGCTMLNTIRLPKNLENIQVSAFTNTGLTSIYLEATQPPTAQVYNNVFEPVNYVLYVPTGSKANYENYDPKETSQYKYWTMFKEIKEFNP